MPGFTLEVCLTAGIHGKIVICRGVCIQIFIIYMFDGCNYSQSAVWVIYVFSVKPRFNEVPLGTREIGSLYRGSAPYI